jgi:hypothetical protein
VQITAVAIDLPNLDDDIPQRFAGEVEYATREMRYFTDRGRDRVVDNDEIIVGIERKLVGIERPFGLSWRGGEGFRPAPRAEVVRRNVRREGIESCSSFPECVAFRLVGDLYQLIEWPRGDAFGRFVALDVEPLAFELDLAILFHGDV